jgi:hypothetical protein
MLGSMRIEGLKTPLPVIGVRLEGGAVHLTGERHLRWREHLPAGRHCVVLVGSDGVAVDANFGVDLDGAGWGDLLRIDLTLSPNDQRDQTWVALRRVAKELPQRRAILGR